VAKARSHTPHYRLAGLEPLGGRSRRWRDIRTGETLSYNAGRRRVEALSAGHRDSVAQFERALARTRDVEQARREAGFSKRGLDAYRKSFTTLGREGASPWIKDRGRWRFDGARFSRVHTFVDIHGPKASIKRRRDRTPRWFGSRLSSFGPTLTGALTTISVLRFFGREVV
jgi:hypothetical protein